ncbi:hypothetical protein SLEP1_g60162, partial [Rubroshorea leprosula]
MTEEVFKDIFNNFRLALERRNHTRSSVKEFNLKDCPPKMRVFLPWSLIPQPGSEDHASA